MFKPVNRWLGWLLALFVSALAGAEDAGPLWGAFLRPADGQVVEIVRADRLCQALADDAGHYQWVSERDRKYVPEPDDIRWQDQKSLKLPAHAYAWKRTVSGDLLCFINQGKPDENGEQPYDSPGVMVLCDASTGEVRWRLPGQVKQWGADRSTGYHPEFAAAPPYALLGSQGRITAYNMEQGKQLWSIPGKFADVRGVDGAWLVNGSLYLNTRRGLCKVDPADGRELWCCPYVGTRVDHISLRPDGTLGVLFNYQPDMLQKGLLGAARTRYPQLKIYGIGQIIPHRTSWFGLVRSAPNLKDYPPKNLTRSVWEWKNERWSFIFDYGTLTPAQANALYARHQFSARMRERLESEW